MRVFEDRWLAVILLACAAYGAIHTQPPVIVKVAIVVVGYVLLVHLIYTYSPYAARWIVSTTLLVIFAVIKGILTCSSGGRRR